VVSTADAYAVRAMGRPRRSPPRPGGLGPLPRCGVAAPPLLRASRPAHRAGGARGAAGADDHPPRLARPLRPVTGGWRVWRCPSGSTSRSAAFWCTSSSTTPVT